MAGESEEPSARIGRYWCHRLEPVINPAVWLEHQSTKGGREYSEMRNSHSCGFVVIM
jgi:hypothetical protein